MKKSKLLNILVSTIMVVCMLFTTVYAAFPDVPATKYNWAVDAINSMADQGIIKGYENGTFQPEKSVTKLEGLVLIARVLGANNDENKTFVTEAMSLYEDVIDDYQINFGEEELAYLLLKSVVDIDELDSYIGSSKAGTSLMRYEVAVLLTKALDGEDNLPSSSTLTYADADKVPASAKKYVRYVTEEGLMNGMEDNKFSPNTGVTRAQAAVLLNKLLAKTDYTFRTGTVVEISKITGILKLKDSEGSTISHNILPEVILRDGGNVISASQIQTGSLASITYKNAEVYAIDFVPSNADNQVCGLLTSISTQSTTSIGVSVIEPDAIEPSDEKTTYTLASDCVVTFNGSASSIGALKTGCYVELDIKSGKVKSIKAQDRETNVSGTIESVVFEPTFKIAVTDKNGDTKYYLFKDSATITRNGKKVDAAALTEGDMVSLTLDCGIIKKVVASSKTTTKSGVITQILISSKPKLTLTIDGEDVTYSLSPKATYSVTGAEGTNSIYDLRTNTVATVTLESDTITVVKTSAITENKTITGEVISVTPAANVFQVRYIDAATGVYQTDTILVNSKTKIMDTNAKEKKIAALTIGTNVSVYGTIGSGVVSATTVMILD